MSFFSCSPPVKVLSSRALWEAEQLSPSTPAQTSHVLEEWAGQSRCEKRDRSKPLPFSLCKITGNTLPWSSGGCLQPTWFLSSGPIVVLIPAFTQVKHTSSTREAQENTSLFSLSFWKKKKKTFSRCVIRKWKVQSDLMWLPIQRSSHLLKAIPGTPPILKIGALPYLTSLLRQGPVEL